MYGSYKNFGSDMKTIFKMVLSEQIVVFLVLLFLLFLVYIYIQIRIKKREKAPSEESNKEPLLQIHFMGVSSEFKFKYI